jgi:hypothetical protein
MSDSMAHSVPDIVIQDRDIELLKLLLHSRVLTLAHAAVLVFDGSKEAAKKRIQKLKANGLILERRRKAYEQGVLFLSKKGFLCLKVRAELPPECDDIPSFSKRAQVSELTLKHELEVMDVKAAFQREATKRDDITIAEFSTWPKLNEFSVRDEADRPFGKMKKVKPDGFIRIHQRDPDGSLWEHMYFLEVDRSTEKLDILAQRLRSYNLFYRSGGIAKKFGVAQASFRDFPFRILVICKSNSRVQNLVELLTKNSPSILQQIAVYPMLEAELNPFQPLDSSWQPRSDKGN